MGKHKSDGKKKKKKASQLVIRIEEGERDAFVALCDQLDTTAAREIRRFMREWVAQHALKLDVSPLAEDVTAPSAPDAPAQQEEPVAEKPAVKGKRKPVVEATT